MILGASTFGSGILGADDEITVFGITAIANDATASVALSVTGLDFAQYITITRNNITTGVTSPVRGANGVPIFSGTGYEYGPNLLSSEDTDFETGVGSWGNGANSSAPNQSSTFAYTGQYSLQINGLSAGITETIKGAQPYNMIPVTPGQTYSFSYWCYTTNSTRMADIGVIYYSQPNNTQILYQDLASQGLSYTNLTLGDWTQVTILTTAPAGANYVALFIEPIAQVSSEVFYVDEVYFGTYEFLGIPSGSFTITDYECPLNVEVNYTATTGILIDGMPSEIEATVSNDVELPAASGTVWLKNVLEPALNMQPVISSMSDAAQAARTQSTYVIGRSNPIVLVDAMGGRAGTITFVTEQLSDKATLQALLSSPQSQVLFLQTAEADGFNDMYFSINTSITENRPATASYDSNRLWPVTYIEVDSPADSVTSVLSNTYLDVLGWSSYQDMLTQRPTYLSVLVAPFGDYPGDTP